MLNKVLNIANVGRFLNFGGRNDLLSFAKYTFLTGNNTHGKSTFTAILRSVAENRPELIVGRKSFNAITTEQRVVLETGLGNLIFDGQSWNGTLPIKIFDATYVTENIYSNDYVDEAKQETIATLILGSEGQRLEENYVQAKTACDNNSKEKSRITNLFTSVLGHGLVEFAVFRKLQVDDAAVQTQIDTISKRIQALENQAKISQEIDQLAAKFQQIVNFDGTSINQTLQVNQQLVRDHIRQNFSDQNGALGFLSTALSKQNLDNDPQKCFFCGQEIVNGTDADALLHAYQDLFSSIYRSLAIAVKDAVKFFQELDFENWLLGANDRLSDTGIRIDASDKLTSLKVARETLVEHLQQKQSDLNIPTETEKLETLVTLSKEFISKHLEPIKEQFASGTSDEKTKLTRELNILKIQKQRNSQQWIDNCKRYQQLEVEFRNTLKPAEEATFTAKNSYASTIFSQYETSINEVLERLRADFRLAEFSPPENRRSQIRLFGLKFNQVDEVIPLVAGDDIPNFKNTLSDSDKRLLAFAFFIADLRRMYDLSQTIVVFDDPISSLDSKRQRATVSVLQNLLQDNQGQGPEQLIVLTHEDRFFWLLNELFRHDKKLLEISYSNTSQSSLIGVCDFDAKFRDKHYDRLESISRFANREVDVCDMRDLRIVLEHIIDRKYYLSIDPIRRSNGGILGWYLETKTNDPISTRINNLLPNLPHHDQPEVDLADFDLEVSRDIAIDLLEIIEEI